MTPSFLPTAFRLLSLNPNRAIDDALIRCLPFLDESTQEAACQLLLRRKHAPSLVKLVTRFPHDQPGLRALLASSIEPLFPVLPDMIRSSRADECVAAVELLTASLHPLTVDLLSDALTTPHAPARTRAAVGLRDAAQRWLAQGSGKQPLPRRHPATPGAQPVDAHQLLTAALTRAIRHWESHQEPAVLDAVLWLHVPLRAAIQKKLDEPRSSFGKALSARLTTLDDAHSAPILVRALAMPSLRAAAVQGISAAREPAVRAAILHAAWMLADLEVEKGARQLRTASWFTEYLDQQEDDELACRALRWMTACGNPTAERMTLLQRAVDGWHEGARREALWMLAADHDEQSLPLLSAIAQRGTDPLARIAIRALRRRGVRTAIPPTAVGNPGRPSPSPRAFCEQYWSDLIQAEQHGEPCRTPLPRTPEWLAFLRAKLACGNPMERHRALNVALKSPDLHTLQSEVMKLVHDADPGVRALAVQALAGVDAPAAARLARQAVRDPHPRVQANAVEALESMDQPDRAEVTLPQLDSPIQRVRANAIKSLLKLELSQAADALLAMLSDPSPAHRLSALWVVDQLHLRSLAPGIADLAATDPVIAVRKKAERVLRRLQSASAAQLTSQTVAGDQRR